jgi:hypothetical protein
MDGWNTDPNGADEKIDGMGDDGIVEAGNECANEADAIANALEHWANLLPN